MARPKIGLVLSGGGARGIAHIGVLRMLEAYRIPIDYIVGTSMGAVIGGLYASGMSTDEIEDLVLTTEPKVLFGDAIPRAERSFRRKRDDDLFLIALKLGFSEGKIKAPAGLIEGENIDLLLRSLTLSAETTTDFDHLSTPFRAVATDIETGKPVVLASGDLVTAIRASMAIPAIFSPVQIGDRVLVDGGVSMNLPVSVAREMGADIVIAIDVSRPLSKREALNSPLAVTEQITSILTQRGTAEELGKLTDRDILIVPDLGDMGSADFDRAGVAIPAGISAAERRTAALTLLSLSPGDYATYQTRRLRRRRDVPVIDFVRIDNRSRLADAVIASRLTVRAGEPLDVAKLTADLHRIYGMELFELVTYDIVEEDGKTGLVIHVRENSWGPGYLQLGAEIEANLEGDSNLTLGAGYLRTMINKLGGEWRTLLQFGEEARAFTEVYQPLDVGSRYFVNGRLDAGRQNVNLFDNQGNRVAEFQVSRAGLDLAGGREFGAWGEVRLGWRRFTGTAEVRVGDPSLPDIDFDTGEIFARLLLDTLDNVNFPRAGAFGGLEYIRSRERFGADTEFSQVLLQGAYARSWARDTLILDGRLFSTVDGTAPVQSVFRAGGFLRLSGFQRNELSGQYYGQLSARYLRRIADIAFLPTYAGISLELGNVWQDKSEITLRNTLLAGSVFVGVDSVMGPVYLAYGHAEGEHDSVYFFLGRVF